MMNNATDWSQVEIEKIGCPLCGGFKRWNLQNQGVFEHFALVRCAHCRFLYLNPRPTEAAMLGHYAQDSYFEGAETGGYASYQAQAETLSLTFRRLMQNLQKREMTGGSLLEVGCGYGFLLKQAQPFFKQVVATDFSAGALEKAKPFADQVYQGGFKDIPQAARFDTIIANHVIEHVYDLQLFMQDCKSRLKPGGWLVLSTPDAGSFWRKLMGRRWPSYIVPDHLHYFSGIHLGRLFTESGLLDIQTLPYPHAFPLKLIAQKLAMKVPQRWEKHCFWIPKTTVAIAGRLAG